MHGRISWLRLSWWLYNIPLCIYILKAILCLCTRGRNIPRTERPFWLSEWLRLDHHSLHHISGAAGLERLWVTNTISWLPLQVCPIADRVRCQKGLCLLPQTPVKLSNLTALNSCPGCILSGYWSPQDCFPWVLALSQGLLYLCMPRQPHWLQ